VRLAIDATNISSGGGLVHLKSLLANFDLTNSVFDQVCIWGSKKTLSTLEKKDWLRLFSNKHLDGNLWSRNIWKLLYFSRAVKAERCDLLFAPGGSYTGGFKSFVTMSQNMLPMEWNEMRRFGLSLMFFKLLALRFVQLKTFRKAHGLIFLTQYARDEVLKLAGNIKATSTIIPHGINSYFRSTGGKSPAQDMTVNVIYVSIIDMYKHQWNVVKAARLLRDKGINVSITFVGPASPKAYRKFCAALEQYDPAGEFCHYVGNVGHEKLPDYYAAADICLFASTCENQPIILLEGMASGLPIVCSDKDPMPEILKDGGIYFDAESHESIACALEKLINSDELKNKLASTSVGIAKNYTWSKTAQATLNFLEQVAQDNLSHST